jgi:hypothetical protein
MAHSRDADPAPIAKLPTELVDAVAGLLDKSSLCSLALVSKSKSPSATDILYKEYVNREPPSQAPFATFLRTMCERPDLAAKIKFVDIRGWRSEFEVATGAAWRGITTIPQEEVTGKGRNGGGRPKKSSSLSGTFSLFVEAAARIGLIAKRESYPVPALKHTVK